MNSSEGSLMAAAEAFQEIVRESRFSKMGFITIKEPERHFSEQCPSCIFYGNGPMPCTSRLGCNYAYNPVGKA